MDFKAGEIFAIDKPYRVSSFGALAHVRLQEVSNAFLSPSVDSP